MGAAGSVPLRQEDQDEVRRALANKFAVLRKGLDEADAAALPQDVPETLQECLAAGPPADEAGAAAASVYGELARELEERLEEITPPEIVTAVKGLPEALDTAVYQHERWPVVLDPSGQGARFLKYQRGTFLMAQNPLDMDAENLRRSLVGALGHGMFLIVHFDDAEVVDLDAWFAPSTFPEEVVSKLALFKQETWSQLLRSDQGDAAPDMFIPRDDFKLVVVAGNEAAGKAFASKHNLAVVKVLDPSEGHGGKASSGRGDPGADEIAAAFGARDVKRNSPKLVEAAFDGEWDAVQEFLDKGYSFDSEDVHKHTALSEAACQGHNDVCRKLLELGADPNSQNDTGRTPMYRAAYNGHLDTVQLLLEAGGDPRLTSNMESPFDVAKTDEVREALEAWDVAETDRLLAARKKEEEARIEARLTTAAERDAYAREKIRQELVTLTLEGKCKELEERLQELADEALEHNERPRGSAEARDERGNTLLLVAVWKGHIELVQMLLTKYKEFDPEFDKVERKVFFSNIKGRDPKGWNACSLATFHGHKKVLQLLLEAGADPYVKTSYNKNSFDFAQDEKDAARNVVTDRSEIRGILLEWERLQNPREAALREKQEAAAAAAAAAAAEEGTGKSKDKDKDKSKDKKKQNSGGTGTGAKKKKAKKKAVK